MLVEVKPSKCRHKKTSLKMNPRRPKTKLKKSLLFCPLLYFTWFVVIVKVTVGQFYIQI